MSVNRFVSEIVVPFGEVAIRRSTIPLLITTTPSPRAQATERVVTSETTQSEVIAAGSESSQGSGSSAVPASTADPMPPHSRHVAKMRRVWAPKARSRRTAVEREQASGMPVVRESLPRSAQSWPLTPSGAPADGVDCCRFCPAC